MAHIKIYQKKPVQIQAVQLTEENLSDVLTWCNGRLSERDGQKKVVIPTLEGPIKGDIGDFIIKGIKGEFYPCKPDIFADSYDEVSEVREDGYVTTPVEQVASRNYGVITSSTMPTTVEKI